MENNKIEVKRLIDPAIVELKEKIKIGLELSFKNLVKHKCQTGGTFVFSENGVIKKIKAEDVKD